MKVADYEYITACHEAGHATAYLLRGARITELHLNGDDGHFGFVDGSGVKYAFIAYAGPWAEARLCWSEAAIDDNTVDADGRRFADHVAAALSRNDNDWSNFEREIGGDVGAVLWAMVERMTKGRSYVARFITTPDPAWDEELEARWPEIQELAARMLARDDVLDVGSNEPLVREP